MLTAAAAVVVAAAVSVVAVRSHDRTDPPANLVDGSTALAEPPGLPRGVRGVVHVRRAEDVDPRLLRSCLALVGGGRLPPETLVVERIGVDGRSLTFRDARVPRLYGCDASSRTDEPRSGGWCGAAVGTLERGRPTDSRLDVAGCRDARGRPVAFAWIEPPPRAEWLAVARDGGIEYHRTAGGLPVRVASADAVAGAASAEYRVRAYGPGVDDAERMVRVAVAG